MSSSPVHTKSYVFRPLQIWPPAQYIQSLMSSGHYKYVFQPSTYKVLCLQATTNMSSSPVHTKSYVFRPQQIWPPVLFTYLYTKYYKCLQAITNMSSSPVYIYTIFYIQPFAPIYTLSIPSVCRP